MSRRAWMRFFTSIQIYANPYEGSPMPYKATLRQSLSFLEGT
ncbi:MAG: hypothetical protein QXI39_09935 [Candidatus Bathyarchaeia archaeon]